ncbi:ribosome maturation factor RimP [Pacificimonas sp. WHA3]|uniref:Ribosome maturation factor RimP n=1 Tax=Pacificimonas pallii TaxID=2827236 RepID=A0ABS6SCW2_9SPHN|nr:ribosome maturation factor RimP [Pacificimonas pallii]MBV7255948.1 ribosome maturation factor RimP [Pacificimonas pallii]
MADIAALTALVEPLVIARGWELVRIKMTTGEMGKTLQIMAEDPATGQLVVDQCAALSREVSELFDEVDPIEEEYNLEVSSPGIDRPLTRAKDFALWAGHKAKITLTDAIDGRKKFAGTLLGLEGEAAQLRLEDGSEAVMTFPIDAIHGAKLVLTDALIAATQPQSLN